MKSAAVKKSISDLEELTTNVSASQLSSLYFFKQLCNWVTPTGAGTAIVK
jgi:hypothetical protein